MEVWNQPAIDIGLTVLGYLVATALGMVIYSAYHSRRLAKSQQPTVAAATVTPEETVLPERRERTNRSVAAGRPATRDHAQYLNLSSQQTRPSVPPSRPADKPSAFTHQARRDRIEMIRLAREMLKAGTAGSMIQRTLPISDAELALLQTGNND